MRLKLNVDEFRALQTLEPFASTNDPRFMSICCILHEGVPTWISTDRRRLAQLVRGRVSEPGSPVAIPLREVRVIQSLLSEDAEGEIEISCNGERGWITTPWMGLDFRNRPEHIAAIFSASITLPQPDREAIVFSSNLAAAIEAAIVPPALLRPDALKQFTLSVYSARQMIVVTTSWVGHPDTNAFVFCEAASDGRVAVDPKTLLAVISVTDDERTTLDIGPSFGTPLRVRGEKGLSVTVMPSNYGVDVDRPQFERVLAEIMELPRNQIVRDEDGDYELPLRNGRMAWIRLVPGDPSLKVPNYVKIFTTLVNKVEGNLETLSEINAQNARFPFVRTYQASDGSVQLEADAVLEGATTPEVRSRIELFADIADNLGPAMRSYFGVETSRGHDAPPGELPPAGDSDTPRKEEA